MLRAPLLALAGLAFVFSASAADDGPGDGVDDATLLSTITVSATRTEREVANTPGTVTVKDREQLDRELVTDIRDLVRYEPGVSVAGQPTRFGLSGFNIRGIDGNRVLIEIDGIRVPDAFQIGSFSNAGRDLVDIDLLKRVEIVRGAASSLYGSSAIGGVVSFQTKDPEDFLGPEDSGHIGLKAGWYGADEGRYGGITAAAGGERAAILFGFSHREGRETENRGHDDSDGATRTTPNPQRYEVDSALVKTVFRPADGHRLELAFETGRGDTRTDVRSGRTTTVSVNPGTGTVTSTVQVLDLAGDDRRERTRYGAQYRYQPDTGWIDQIDAQVYHQRSRTEQFTYELRETTAAASGVVTPQERHRRFTFNQELDGAELMLRKDVDWGGSRHRLIAGLDYLQTEVDQLRDGHARNPVTGVVTSSIAPDVFPVRDFPSATIRESAVFVQDEVDLFEGRLSLIPGLRLDRYRLQPRPDAIFEEDNPGVEPSALRNNRVSPKFGALWWFTPNWALTGQYARGFRAPPYNDVNVGFTNLQFGYTAIPNPNLKPETSTSLEAGLRAAYDWGRLSFTAFDNRYDDFIESLIALPPGHPDAVPGLLTFQSQNLNKVRIRGAEAAAALAFGHFAAGLDGFSLRAAVSYARGDDETNDQPLISVDPARLVTGLAYDDPAGRWGLELVGTAVRRQSRLPEREPALFASPGRVVVDLLGYWRPLTGVSVHAGVFNLGDRTYVEWADARLAGLSASSSVLDRYTRPGRNASVNVQFAF